MDELLVDDLCGCVLSAARAVLDEALIGGIVKGSAINGDFFATYSDFDIR